MRQKIYQFVAGFRRGDAISTCALLMRSVFRSWGCEAEIVCGRNCVEPLDRHEVVFLDDAAARLGPDDVALLHLSIGTPTNLFFEKLVCRKAIDYHNVTPAKYFRFINTALAADLAEGRRHVERLRGAAAVNLADSAYNAAELTEAGYSNVRVLPLPIDIEALRPDPRQVDKATLDHFKDGAHRNVLFVGRLVPNKRIDDLVRALCVLRQIEPRARLVHVGAFQTGDLYSALVLASAKAMGVEDSVCLLGGVRQPVLNACYEAADAFLCLSEHEGFCAPLIEAMLHRVPVLSLASAAIPETLAGAGVLFAPPPDFPLIAETIAEVWRNPALREAILARQDRRVEQFRTRDLSAELREALAPLLLIP